MSILVEPMDLMPGYNPIYLYATSSNVNETNFRYVVQLSSLTSPIGSLGEFKVRPRFGDNFLEINIQKALESRLGDLTDDVDLNSLTSVFNRTISSNLFYRIELKEEFLVKNIPNGFNNSGGFLQISFPTSQNISYVAGDFIKMTGAANRKAYISIDDNGGNARFNFSTAHSFTNGDEVLIRQNSPTLFNQYEGLTTILSSTSNSITIDIPYQGVSFIAQTGFVILNNRYDGIHFITNKSTSGGNDLLTTNTLFGFSDSTTLSASRVFYADERSTLSSNLLNKTFDTFNGSVEFVDFMDWDFVDYNPISGTAVNNAKFLTTLPYDMLVREDNDYFLNFWGKTLSGAVGSLQVKTYNSSDALVGSYSIPNDILLGNQTRVLNISVGPRGLDNACYGVESISNGNFGATGSWNIFNTGNGIGTISGGNLNYTDDDEFGGAGLVLITQTNVLIPGQTYTITLNILNNLECEVSVGDSAGVSLVVNLNETGTFTYTFAPTTTDFWMTIEGVGATTHGLQMSSISVLQGICVDLECPNVSYYTIQLMKTNGTPQSEIRTFYLDCGCDKYKNYPLLFMDRFGSFVSLNFELNNKQMVQIERKNYKRVIGDRVGNKYEYSLTDRSKKIYDIEMKEVWTLNSDYISEDLAAYYEELFTSPNVMILIDGEYRSVMIMNDMYDRKTLENDDLIMYSIDIEFVNNNKVQV
jgi:hypothetical protein